MPRHVLKGNERTEAASLWAFFDCESRTVPLPGEREKVQHILRLGRVLFRRLAGGQPIQDTWHTFRNPDSFWQFIEAHMSAHRPLWLVAHNTAFDWPLVGGYDYLQAHNLDKWRLIFGPPVTLMSGSPNGKKLVVVDSLNYFRASAAQLGGWLGLPKLPFPGFDAPDDVTEAYCTRDVEIIAEAMLRLVQLHRSEDLGVLGKTLAQCAIHSYRHRLGAHVTRPVAPDSRAAQRGRKTETSTKIAMHGDDEVTAFERAAYFGGRVECKRIGALDGPIYQLDANSLYAAVMKSTPMPCALRQTVKEAPLDWLAEQLALYEVVAAVDVTATRATYPYRCALTLPMAQQCGITEADWQKARLRCGPLYPHGTYSTVLCGTELRRCLARGDLTRVKAAAVYERADLFGGYVDYWYGRRLAAFASGDKFAERLAKSYLTALAGVWAKHSAKWLACPDHVCNDAWEKLTMWDAIDQKIRTIRVIAGVAQEQVEDGEPFDVLPVVSACITSEARERVRDWQRLAGYEHWLYEDTDSLLVDQAGYDRLVGAGQVHETRLGALRLQSVSAKVIIRGVKDYQLDDKRVVKGVRADAEWIDERTVRQEHWSGHQQSHAARDRIGPTTELRTLHLTAPYIKGAVDSAGHVTPFQLDHTFEPFDLF